MRWFGDDKSMVGLVERSCGPGFALRVPGTAVLDRSEFWRAVVDGWPVRDFWFLFRRSNFVSEIKGFRASPGIFGSLVGHLVSPSIYMTSNGYAGNSHDFLDLDSLWLSRKGRPEGRPLKRGGKTPAILAPLGEPVEPLEVVEAAFPRWDRGGRWDRQAGR